MADEEKATCENCIHLKDYYKVYLWQVLEGKIQPNLEEIKKEGKNVLRRKI